MIFDTDVLIWAAWGNLHAGRAIDAAADRALSIVSFMELLQGARSKLEARKIQQSLRQPQFRILPLSEPIGATAPPSSSSTPWPTAFNWPTPSSPPQPSNRATRSAPPTSSTSAPSAPFRG